MPPVNYGSAKICVIIGKKGLFFTKNMSAAGKRYRFELPLYFNTQRTLLKEAG